MQEFRDLYAFFFGLPADTGNVTTKRAFPTEKDSQVLRRLLWRNAPVPNCRRSCLQSFLSLRTTYFVFSPANFSAFDSIHRSIRSRFSFATFLTSSMPVPVTISARSSAYPMVHDVPLSSSLRTLSYAMFHSSPKTEPCETPACVS